MKSIIREIPVISVLIPVYNCSRYIKEALSSVISQTYQKFEILVINDGSTDDTVKIIQQFKDDRIRLYHNTSNRGIVKTLNKGIDLAIGKYIARFDGDDIMMGNRLSEQVYFLENNIEYGMVSSWYNVINENGAFLKTIKNPTDHDQLKLSLIFKNQFAHSATTVRSNLLKQFKYNEDFQYIEDYELWTRLSEISKVANIPNCHLGYRWHKSNSCSTHQRELKLAAMKLWSRQLNKHGITHSVEELMVHGLLCFGNRSIFEKKDIWKSKINSWIAKLCSSEKLKQDFPQSALDQLEKEMYNY